MKWRRQLEMNNIIHLYGCPFLLARPEVTKNLHLDILIIDTPKNIWKNKVKNRYIPHDYSDDIDNGLFDYSYYGKAVFKPKVDWKAHI